MPLSNPASHLITVVRTLSGKKYTQNLTVAASAADGAMLTLVVRFTMVESKESYVHGWNMIFFSYLLR